MAIRQPIPFQGEFQFYVSELLQRQQLFIKQPNSNDWGFHLVFSPSTQAVSIGIVGSTPFVFSGFLSVNNRIAEISTVVNNETGVHTFGVCNFFKLNEINGFSGRIKYDLRMSFSMSSPMSSQSQLNNSFTSTTSSEAIPIFGAIDEYIGFRTSYRIPIDKLKECKVVTTEKKSLICNKKFHVWMTMIPGRVARNGGSRDWSVGFSLDCNDADIQGFFFCDGERDEYDLRDRPIHEMGLTTVSFNEFFVSSRDLQRKNPRSKNGFLEIAVRLKIYIPQNAFATQPKMEPIPVSPEPESDEVFELSNLLLSVEGRKTADCVVYARNEKIDYIHSAILGLHSQGLLRQFQETQEGEIQPIEDDKYLVMTFPYSKKTIKRFVEFIYYGKFKQEPTESEFSEILHFVVEYDMINFEQYLLNSMSKITDERNVCMLLEIAHRAGNSKAKEQCIKFFADRPDQFFNIPGISSLPQDLANELFDAVRKRQAIPKTEPMEQIEQGRNSTIPDILVKVEPLDEDALLGIDEGNGTIDVDYDEEDLLNSPNDDCLTKELIAENDMETEEGEVP